MIDTAISYSFADLERILAWVRSADSRSKTRRVLLDVLLRWYAEQPPMQCSTV
jgi:hypothetical protein